MFVKIPSNRIIKQRYTPVDDAPHPNASRNVLEFQLISVTKNMCCAVSKIHLCCFVVIHIRCCYAKFTVKGGGHCLRGGSLGAWSLRKFW